MRRRWGAALAVAAALLANGLGRSAQADAAKVVQLVASPNGDGKRCDSKAPCTLSEAQHRTQLVDAGADVEVVLADGTYRLSEPLTFTAADGGRNGHRVTYRNAAGAHPTISGGIPVVGWTPDGATGIWSAPIGAGVTSRELYVNGQRAPRSSIAPPGAWKQTPSGYLTTDTSVLAWPDPATVELVFNEGNGFWTEPRCDVASVAPAAGGAAVTLRQPCWSNLHIPDDPTAAAGPSGVNGDNAMGGFEGLSAANPPSAIENTGESLTTGQWYLDRTAHRVRYAAPAGVDPNQADIVLPVLEQLVVGLGTLDQPITNLELSGLTFAHTTWLQPSGNDGFAEMQANMTLTGPNASGSDPASGGIPEGTCQYTSPAGTCPFGAWTKPPASVSFRAAHGVTLRGNTFTHLGAAGVALAYGSQDNRVFGNEVTDTSGSGIMLGDTNDALPSYVGADDREINRGNAIVDNYVHHVAAEYHGGVGIWVGYVRDTLIAHNQLSHLPYSGISMGWGGWHTDSLHPDNPSIMGGNTVADNLIEDYQITLPDGGAIYTNGTQGPFDPAGPAANPFLVAVTSPEQMRRGLTITGNVALVATWSEFAYYNDEGGDYITYGRNVEYQNHAMAHGGCDTVGHIRIDDNFWAQPLGGYICPPPPVDITLSNHHVIPDHPGPSDIPNDILANAGLEPAYRGLITSRAPDVSGVGPGGPGYAAGPTSQPILVSGTGFTPASAVYFGTPGPTTAARQVRVLSGNYLIAFPPTAVAPGQVDVIVATTSGTTAPHPADQYVLLPG
jgi:hypothetical protein